jgi:hypothetical protein
VTWVKKDDRHHREETTEALLALGNIAGWANTLDDWAESWCGEHLTDGVVPRHVPARLIGHDPSAELAALVKVGRWAPIPEGWLLTTSLARNPTRERVLAVRAERQRAGREGGKKNTKEADVTGRRRDDGTYAPKPLLGGMNGLDLGRTPSKRPSNEPTPSPVSRLPDSPLPDSTSPPPPSPTAERGRRNDGSNARRRGANPRAIGTDLRGNGANPRQVRATEKRNSPQLAGTVLAEMARALEPRS